MPDNRFTDDFIKQSLMGPNVVLMLEELCGGRLPDGRCARICDLGCGAGLSSLAIASAGEGCVHAVDAWNSPEDNGDRFNAFPFGEHIVAVQAEAPDLPFDEGFFDALVCLDSYNYFGRAEGVIDKVASYVKPSGKLYLAIPGVRSEPTPADLEVFGLSWSTEQMAYIKTPGWWEGLLSRSRSVRIERMFLMRCHEQAWRDWLACENPYAIGDRSACEAGAIDLMCTIGIELSRTR